MFINEMIVFQDTPVPDSEIYVAVKTCEKFHKDRGGHFSAIDYL